MSFRNNQSNKHLLSPMEDEPNGNAGFGEDRNKSLVTKERLNFEMSELGRPVLSRATSLLEAVRDGVADLVKEQLGKKNNAKNIDKLDQSGLALLHQAARYDRTNVARCLLDYGARIDVRSREDQLTPLHIAARLVTYAFSRKFVVYLYVVVFCAELYAFRSGICNLHCSMNCF